MVGKRAAMEKHELDAAIVTLIDECAWHFDNVDRYNELKDEFQRREREIVRPIGERLHQAGGFELMQQVYRQVEATTLRLCGKGCRSALDMKWDGIGDWRG